MERRRIVIGLVLLPVAAHSQPTAVVIAIEAVSKVLKDTGEALADFSNNLAKTLHNAFVIYDNVAARRDVAQLKKISQDMAISVATKQSLIVTSIDDYISYTRGTNGKPFPESDRDYAWQAIKENIETAVTGVRKLLSDVRDVDSKLVTNKAYLDMLESLGNRGLALDKLNRLANLPPPSTPDELTSLEGLSRNYRALLATAKSTIQELNAFIEARSKP